MWTIPWYVDHTHAPSEPGFLRFTSVEAMLAMIRVELNARLVLVERTGKRLQIDGDRLAIVLFLDAPLTTLADSSARGLVLEIIRSAGDAGVYVALQLNRAEREQLQGMGAWGAGVMEALRRDQAGYPVYGNW